MEGKIILKEWNEVETTKGGQEGRVYLRKGRMISMGRDGKGS